MKKKLIAILALIFIITGCSSGSKDFMSGYKGFDKKDHHYVQTSAEDMFNKLEAKEPGLYYFGFDTCPWCVALVPVLENVATEVDQKIQYLDIRSDDFSKYSKAEERYFAFNDTLPTQYRNDKFQVPFLVSISKSGNIVTHLGTIDGHDGQTPLSEQDIDFLSVRLKEMFLNTTK